MKKVRWVAVSGSAVAAAALALSLGSSAGAGRIGTNAQHGGAPAGVNLGASASTATATTVNHYTLAASAFAPDGTHTINEGWFSGWYPSTLSNTTPFRCFAAGVVLPSGATIKSVTFHFTQGSGFFQGQLNRQTLSNHTFLELAYAATTGITGTPYYTSETVKVTKGQVVNSSDGYSLGACFYGTTTFSGATVNYTG